MPSHEGVTMTDADRDLHDEVHDLLWEGYMDDMMDVALAAMSIEDRNRLIDEWQEEVESERRLMEAEYAHQYGW
jgi:hypothetical protein